MTTLTDKDRRIIANMIRAKLAFWDATTKAEHHFGQDIDGDSYGFAYLCGMIDDPKDIDDLTDEQLTQAVLGK